MNNYLSKVERDLILTHLIDEKPLLLLKPLTTKYLPHEKESFQFPQITIQPHSYHLVNKGIIFFPFKDFSFTIPHGTALAVIFHFKGRALIFESQFSHLEKGYALVISPYIFKQTDDRLSEEKRIKGNFYFGLQNDPSLSVPFFSRPSTPLFSIDLWKDLSADAEKKLLRLIETEFNIKQSLSELYIESNQNEKKLYYPFVNIALYLSQKEERTNESFLGRARPLEIIFLSDTSIVFASESIREIMHEQSEYFISIKIPVLRLTRTIDCTVFVDQVLFDSIDGVHKEVALCSIRSLQEENRRFLKEKLYGLDSEFSFD